MRLALSIEQHTTLNQELEDLQRKAASVSLIMKGMAMSLGERIKELENELRVERMCDGCMGRGDDPNCGCRGTGLMSEMIVSLRQTALIDQPREIRELKDKIQNLEEQMSTFSGAYFRKA